TLLGAEVPQGPFEFGFEPPPVAERLAGVVRAEKELEASKSQAGIVALMAVAPPGVDPGRFKVMKMEA
ncbi:unnamed protein product, partial [Symbiodinium microadriaticum]